MESRCEGVHRINIATGVVELREVELDVHFP